MDELTVEPDAEEPKRKRKRRRRRAIHADELTAAPDDEKPEPSKRKRHRKRAVHVSSRQDDSNPQDSVEPVDNHDTDVQGLSSKRPKNVSSERPTRVGETSVDQWFVVETSVVETSAPLGHTGDLCKNG